MGKELFIKSPTEELYKKSDINDDAITFVLEDGNESIFVRKEKYQSVPKNWSDGQFLAFKNGHPEWSNTKEFNENKVLDTLVYDSYLNKLLVSSDPFSIDLERYVPVGVCVIPESHGILKTGDGKTNLAGFMSLVPMSYSNPNGGSDTNNKMSWGANARADEIKDRSDDLNRYDSISGGLLAYTRAIRSSKKDANNASSLSSLPSRIPLQKDINSNVTFSMLYYGPSPYLGEDLYGEIMLNRGDHNIAYSTTAFDGSYLNAMADFKGVNNTKIITDAAISQEDWRVPYTYAASKENTTINYIEANGHPNDFDEKQDDAIGGFQSIFTGYNTGGSFGTIYFTCKSKSTITLVATSCGEYDSAYLLVGELDSECTLSNYKYSFKNVRNKKVEITYEIPDDKQHYINLFYCNAQEYIQNTDDNPDYFFSVYIKRDPSLLGPNSIANLTSSGYYPAACCCARYFTQGTKSFVSCTNQELSNGTDFWYLPAVGELGYIIPNLADINDVISKIIDRYGIGIKLPTSSNSYFWSSTKNAYNSTDIIDTNDGSLYSSSNTSSNYVRAFLRGKYDRLN